MIIDFRYHVISLVAVFIALGIGILIGSTLVGQDFIENIAKEQDIWIGKLENDYLTLKEETNDLKLELAQKQEEMNYYKNLMLKIKPDLIKNRLHEKVFAIIQMDSDGPYNEVKQVLQEAGAKVIFCTSFSSKEITQIKDANLFAKEIVKFILEGKSTELLTTLEKNRVIKNMGLYGEPLDGIIFVNGPGAFDRGLISSIEIPIIKFLETKLPVYLVQASSVNNSMIEQIKNMPRVASIENFETIPGQLAFVLALLSQ